MSNGGYKLQINIFNNLRFGNATYKSAKWLIQLNIQFTETLVEQLFRNY